MGDLLGEVCEASTPSSATPASPSPKRGAPKDVSRAVAAVWPEAVGAEVAANASPVQLKNGRLTVATSSSVWADTLRYMGADLTSRLNQRLGSQVVEEMVFRHAGWEERPHQNVPADYPRAAAPTEAGAEANGRLSVEQQEALAGVEELDLPPEIRERVVRAMRAAFARYQGDSVR